MANPVLSAIRSERGLAGKLGEYLGITREAVWQWEKVPPRHAVCVAEYMKLPVQTVCPELFVTPKKRRKTSHRVQP